MAVRVLESLEPGFPGGEAWDRMVAADPRGHLLQTWAWGELKAAFGWVPVRLAVERDGALVAGAQVLQRTIGPLRLGYIPKGPVWVQDNAEVVAALWDAVHARSRRMRSIALKVEPEWRESEIPGTMQDAPPRISCLATRGWQPAPECIQPRRTIIVDLRPPETEILARMKSKWRYNIHLAERKGVEVRAGSGDDLPAFYELLRITGLRDAFGIHTLAYYRRAFELFAPAERVKLLMAYHQGRLLAGLVVYAFNRQAWYMYGASSNEYRELMPNHQLQWRAMQWAKAQGCAHYDLWGIPDEDEDSPTASLAGVGRFKAGFGGELVRYVGAFDYAYIRPLHWLINQLWALRRSRSGLGG